MKKLLVLAVALVTAAGLSVGIATASSAPIVITYAKTCDQGGHCLGTAGNGGTFEMQVTSFRARRLKLDCAIICRRMVGRGTIERTQAMNRAAKRKPY